ncbi:hypothetical protein AWP94_00845 [Escherichia coli]|nr:hypothetical protein AWP86_11780 [Escherichia coli]OKX69052.1 hypothetical protein AWP94_00845 [Escherichia coli]
MAIFPKAMTGAKNQSSDICLMPHVGLIRRGQRRIRHLVQMSDAARTPYPTYKNKFINELEIPLGLIRRASVASGIVCECRMRRKRLI